MNTHSRKALTTVLLGVASASSKVAFAATAGFNGADALASLGDKIETKLARIAENPALVTTGLEILGVLVVLNVVWLLIKGMATGRMLDAFLADALPLAVGTVAALMFIDGVGGQTSNIISAVAATMNYLIQLVSPDTSGLGLGALISMSIGKIIVIIVNMFHMDVALPSIGEVFTFGGPMTAAFAFVVGAAIKVVGIIGSAIFILLALGIFVANLVMSQVSLTIAIIFMPIFVPFLIFKPLSGFFETWLKFFITAWFMKIVGLLMLTMSMVIVDAMNETSGLLSADSQTAGDSIQFNVILYASLVLMSALMAILMLKVNSIASGLVGSTSAGFGGWGEMTRGVMSQGPMGGMGKAPPGGGGGSAGKSPGGGSGSGSHAWSGAEKFAPNALKPIMSYGGQAVSKSQGASMAKNDIQDRETQRYQFRGPSQSNTGGELGRDTSSMSSATQNAYRKYVEGVNSANKANGHDNYTIPQEQSSTSGRHPDNLKKPR